MKTLDRLKLADNTLIVLCSDNGPVLDDGYQDGAVTKLGSHQPAGPLSGGKYSVLEGGTRTPFITRWSGRIKPGTSEQVVCTIDLAASVASLTGVALKDDACLDSLNLLPALLGEPGAKGRDHLLQQDNNGTNLGLRMGDWKLVRQKNKGKSQAVVTKKKRQDAPGLYHLYFLPEDQAETKDLSQQNPHKLKDMIAKIDAIVAAKRTR
jgi:arylsulfatase A